MQGCCYSSAELRTRFLTPSENRVFSFANHVAKEVRKGLDTVAWYQNFGRKKR